MYQLESDHRAINAGHRVVPSGKYASMFATNGRELSLRDMATGVKGASRAEITKQLECSCNKVRHLVNSEEARCGKLHLIYLTRRPKVWTVVTNSLPHDYGPDGAESRRTAPRLLCQRRGLHRTAGNPVLGGRARLSTVLPPSTIVEFGVFPPPLKLSPIVPLSFKVNGQQSGPSIMDVCRLWWLFTRPAEPVVGRRGNRRCVLESIKGSMFHPGEGNT